MCGALLVVLSNRHPIGYRVVVRFRDAMNHEKYRTDVKENRQHSEKKMTTSPNVNENNYLHHST